MAKKQLTNEEIIEYIDTLDRAIKSEMDNLQKLRATKRKYNALLLSRKYYDDHEKSTRISNVFELFGKPVKDLTIEEKRIYNNLRQQEYRNKAKNK